MSSSRDLRKLLALPLRFGCHEVLSLNPDFLGRKSLWKSRSQTRREEMFFARPSLSLLSFSLYRSFRPSRGLDRTKETIRAIKTTGTLVVAQRAVEAHGARAAVVAIIGGSSAGSLESPAGSRRLAR